MVTPLRKRKLDTKALYERPPEIEGRLVELEGLSREELLARTQVRNRKDTGYVPSECLLYFVRASRNDSSATGFEQLYRVLAERVRRSLPRAENADSKTVSLTKSAIHNKVFGQFGELLSADREAYAERLDYFEIRFDSSLARLRLSAQKQAWRDENRCVPLEYDQDTGALSHEVEHAVGSFDPFSASRIDDSDYRSRLDAAIDALPLNQIRIIEMLRHGIPIDSKEADAITIAKTLGRSEKTIRTHRDKALVALRVMLGDE